MIAWLLAPAFAADLWVGPGMPYSTVDDAVFAAGNGDRILLLPGTYSGILDGLDGVEVVGIAGAANTVVQPPFAGVTIWEMNFEDTVLTGVTLDGTGNSLPVFVDEGSDLHAHESRFVNGLSPSEDGGCILVEGHLDLEESEVRGCSAGDEDGGGIYVRYASMVVDESVIAENTGDNGGGALCLGSDCSFDRSLFFGNIGDRGGALHLWSAPSTTVVSSSTFCSNEATIDAGAIRIRDSVVEVEGSAFIDNTAVFDGGHIDVWQNNGIASVSVQHSLFVGGDVEFGDGAAIHVEDATATVENSLFGLQSGSVDLFASSDMGTGTITASTSMSWGNSGGGAGVPGVIADDPELIDPDLCLWTAWTFGSNSPAVDAGTGTDLDGTPADLGVLGGPAPLSDVDGDGARPWADCDDDDPDVGPNQPEICDGKDNDCDFEIDEGLATTDWFIDVDQDGYGEGAAIPLCDGFFDLAPEAGDCAPNDASVSPGAVEVCNGIDDDCNGVVDEGFATSAFYEDADGDGFGAGSVVLACQAPVGWVVDGSDCDDGDSGVFPGADETCDGLDEDCDTQVDEEPLDGVPIYEDGDGDGFGAGPALFTTCTPEADDATTDTDCNDGIASVNPGADETCNFTDDDCDGAIDEDAVDAPVLHADSDGDGFGDPDVEVEQCPGAGAVEDDTDCDDTDPDVNPAAEEVAGNTIDEDCDGENELLYSDTDDPDETGEDVGDRRGFCGCGAASPTGLLWPFAFGVLALGRRRDDVVGD